MRAKLLVPAGGSDHSSGGDRSPPSGVYLSGTRSPWPKAELFKLNVISVLLLHRRSLAAPIASSRRRRERRLQRPFIGTRLRGRLQHVCSLTAEKPRVAVRGNRIDTSTSPAVAGRDWMAWRL